MKSWLIKKKKSLQQKYGFKDWCKDDRKGQRVLVKRDIVPVEGFEDRGEEKRNKTNIGAMGNQLTQ